MVLRVRATVMVVTATAVVGALTALAQPAAADDAQCASTKLYTKAGLETTLPTAGNGSTACLMSVGAQGEHVVELQRALALCHGLDIGGGGSLDGIYGAKTREAVRTVQAQVGIDSDGIYGPRTRDVLEWRWYSATGATCAKL